MGLTLGQTVGDYRVIDVIGAGGMGTVYKVQHVISDRIEAMKVILPDLIDTPELAERFVREIRVQARLSHPNIASLHNALRLDDRFLMVMEYVDGETLHARLRRGSLNPSDGIGIALQILSALEYAHSQGIVHRDIKPANIMLTRAGIVKLMDFGIARSLNERHLTRAGAAIGSVYYMSPEQVQGGEVDARSDLYSVGIMLYEMLTGVRPISGDSSWAVMNAHISYTPGPPSAINANIPPLLSAAILRVLEKKPADRFQSASEFAGAVRTIHQRYAWASNEEQFRSPRIEMAPTELAHPTPIPLSLAKPAAPAAPISPPTPAPSSSPALSTGGGAQFDPEGLERVTRELAPYMGPMAKVMVRRTAKKATSWKQLYDALASEIPDGPERRKFLSKRPV
ncbi:MAG: serine/threonine protein kinase [Acidobacteriaceae bacterium]|nr:serine/threonine protein kinase [Acidobacteriaceae bacterium]